MTQIGPSQLFISDIPQFNLMIIAGRQDEMPEPREELQCLHLLGVTGEVMYDLLRDERLSACPSGKWL